MVIEAYGVYRGVLSGLQKVCSGFGLSSLGVTLRERPL